MTADPTIIHWTILPRGVHKGTFVFSALVSFEFKASDKHDTKELLKAWPELVQKLRFNLVTSREPRQQVGLDGGDKVDVLVERIHAEPCSLNWKEYLGLDQNDVYMTEASAQKISVAPASPVRTLAPDLTIKQSPRKSVREALKSAYGMMGGLSSQKNGEHPLDQFRVRVGSLPKPLESLVTQIKEADPWWSRELDRLTNNRREHLRPAFSNAEENGIRTRNELKTLWEDDVVSIERYVQRVPPPIHRPGHVVAMDHRVWLSRKRPHTLRPGDLFVFVDPTESHKLKVSWDIGEPEEGVRSEPSLLIPLGGTIRLTKQKSGNDKESELASWFSQRHLDLEVTFREEPPDAATADRGVTLLRYWCNSQTKQLFRSTVDAAGRPTQWRPVDGDDLASRIDALRDYAQVMRSCGLCFDLTCSEENLPAGVAVAVQPVVDSLPESIPETVKALFTSKLRHSLTLVSLGKNGLATDEFDPKPYPAGGTYLHKSHIRVRTLNEEAAVHSLIRVAEDLATRLGWYFVVNNDGSVRSTETQLSLVDEQMKLVWPKNQRAKGDELKKSDLAMKSVSKIAHRVPVLVNLPFVGMMNSFASLRVDRDEGRAQTLTNIKATCRVSTDDEGIVVQLVRLHDKSNRWEVPGRYSRAEDEQPQLASLTSDGLSVIPASRAVVEALWSASTDLINNRRDAKPLMRGDLLGGFEVLIRKIGDGSTSSCWRSMTGVKLNVCDCERFIPIRAATLHATDGTSEQVSQGRVPPESHAPPTLASFHGRNLAATFKPQNDDQSLSWEAEVVPELRFGTQYDLAVRILDKGLASVVDDSSSVQGIREPNKDEIVTSTCLRWESVAPPVVMLDEPWSQATHPGRTLLRMIVRPDQPRDTRRIVPPRVHRDFALRHGVFDEALREYRQNPTSGVTSLAQFVHGMRELSVNCEVFIANDKGKTEGDAQASGPAWTIRSLKDRGKTDHGLQRMLEFNSNPALLDSPIYVRSHPDDDAFKEGWLPDPLAHGVVVDVVDEAGKSWLESDEVSAPWYPDGRRWPDAKPIQLVTLASESVKRPSVRFAAVSRSIVVTVPKSFVGSIRLRSVCVDDAKRVLGLCTDKDKGEGFGLKPEDLLVTPALDVACAFAVSRPLISPHISSIEHEHAKAMSFAFANFFGTNQPSDSANNTDIADQLQVASDAAKDSSASICLDRSSTGSLILVRKWPKACVECGNIVWKEHKGVVETYNVSPRDTAQSRRAAALDPLDFPFHSGSRDAYRYFYQYWCESHSRFSSDFPQGKNNEAPLLSKMFFDEQRTLLPPPEVRAEYILPLIGWLRQYDEERKVYSSTCQRRSLRVYLSGEPCVSGPGECIGVVFGCIASEAAQNTASEWAADPVTVDTHLAMSRQIPVSEHDEVVTGAADPEAFYPSTPEQIGRIIECDQEALRELKKTRGIHTAYPMFDPDHNKWYVDVHLPEPSQPDAFSKLSLVRVQPGHMQEKASNATNKCGNQVLSIPTELAISKPSHSDFALIASDRVVQVSRTNDDRGIRVVVSGRVPPHAQNGELCSTIRIELFEPVFDHVGTILGWSMCHCPDADSSDSSAPIVRHVGLSNNPDDADVDRAGVILTTEFRWRRKTGPRRLVVTEVQADSAPSAKQLTCTADCERVVYCDILDL